MNVGTKLYGNLSINHGQLIKNVSVKLQIDAREKFGGVRQNNHLGIHPHTC